MKRSIWMLSALLCMGATHAADPVAEPSARATFDALRGLVGEWRGMFADGRAHTVSYRLTANGTVLVETWTMSPTRESMTLYAMDGDRLLATHDCPQGNQPRLRWVGVDTGGRHRFDFLDGTHLQDPEGFHQHDFWMKLDGDARFTRAERYVPNAGDDASTTDEDAAVTYVRVRDSRSPE